MSYKDSQTWGPLGAEGLLRLLEEKDEQYARLQRGETNIFRPLEKNVRHFRLRTVESPSNETYRESPVARAPACGEIPAYILLYKNMEKVFPLLIADSQAGKTDRTLFEMTKKWFVTNYVSVQEFRDIFATWGKMAQGYKFEDAHYVPHAHRIWHRVPRDCRLTIMRFYREYGTFGR